MVILALKSSKSKGNPYSPLCLLWWSSSNIMLFVLYQLYLYLACNKHFCLSHNEVIGWVCTLSHLLVICHFLHHLCLCSPSIHCFQHLSPFVIYIIYILLLCEIVVAILLTQIFGFIVAVLFLLSHNMLIFSLHPIYHIGLFVASLFFIVVVIVIIVIHTWSAVRQSLVYLLIQDTNSDQVLGKRTLRKMMLRMCVGCLMTYLQTWLISSVLAGKT